MTNAPPLTISPQMNELQRQLIGQKIRYVVLTRYRISATLAAVARTTAGRGSDVTADRLLSTREVADQLNVPERTIAYLAEKGELRGTKVGRAWRFRQVDINSYLAERSNHEVHTAE